MFMFEKAVVGSRRYWIWVLCLVAVIGVGVLSYLRQLDTGLGITGGEVLQGSGCLQSDAGDDRAGDGSAFGERPRKRVRRGLARTGDRIAMGTGLWIAEPVGERGGRFRRNHVLELVGFGVSVRPIHSQHIRE